MVVPGDGDSANQCPQFLAVILADPDGRNGGGEGGEGGGGGGVGRGVGGGQGGGWGGGRGDKKSQKKKKLVHICKKYEII